MFNAINSIRDYLISENVFSEDCCNISLDLEELNHPPCDLYLLIKPEHFLSNQSTAAGGHTVLIGEIKMRLWILNHLDEGNRDTNATEQILDKIEEIIEKLQFFFPCDDDDLPRFVEPIRLLDFTDIQRHDVKQFLHVDFRFEGKIKSKKV